MPEAIITLPDGRKARLTGPSREAILEQAGALAGAKPAEPGPDAGAVFKERLGTTVANTILATPSATGDLLAGAAAGLEGTVALARGESANFGERYARHQNEFPASMLRAIPRPKIQDAAAALRSVPALLPGGETPGAAFDRNRANIAAEEAAGRAAHPVAAMAGDIAGGAASLALGRTAAIKSPVSWQGWGDGLRRTAEQGAQAANKVTELAPGVRRQLDVMWNSKPLAALRRGMGRAAETGIEGAALAAANSDNPLEAAAWGAGSQAAGSFLLSSTMDIFRGNLGSAGLKIAAASVGIGSVLQAFKEAAPGGRDRLLESLESGYKKVVIAIAGGMLSGAAGLGRISGETAKNLPVVADALTSLPRGAFLTTVRELTSDDPRAPMAETALTRLQSDPSAFTEEQLRELNRGLRDGKFVDTVARLSNRSEQFRAALAPPPEPKRTGGGF